MTNHPNSAPVIARIAGIGSDFLAFLPWAEAEDWAEVLLSLRRTLLDLRSEVAEALYLEIPHHASKDRRLLLNLRRGCHNGCNIAALVAEALRLSLRTEALPDLLHRLARLEDKLAETESTYEAEYALRYMREIEILAQPLSDSALRRGLTLASPSFSNVIDTLTQQPVERSGYRSREICTLARYMTRAALKLSPYSTLTPVALAEIKPRSIPPIRYVAGERATTSSFRITRYLLDQCCEVLGRHPGIRQHLRVCVNSTLSQIGERHFRFLRPPQLLESEGSPTLTYSRYGLVKARLAGPLPSLLLANPDQGSLAQLISVLRAVYPECSSAELSQAIESLIALGFLVLLFPVPSYHSHFERGLLDFLNTLPPTPPITASCRFLSEIVSLEESYASTSDSAAIVARIEAAVEDLYQAAQSGLPEEASVPLQKGPRHNLYEDCFETSEETLTGSVLELDESALRVAVEAANLIWQIASFHASRHELLLTLEAFIDRHFPGQSLIPLLDLFDRFKPLWEEYLAFLADRPQPIFNPLELGAIADLRNMRLHVRNRLEASLRSTGETEHYSTEDLQEILDDLPPHWLNPLGPSLFLQPADSEASTWVANRLFEGNGRLSSRYTTVMPPEIRERYLRHYKLRSTLSVAGERAELLDLQYTKNSTTNVHWPQTAKVLVTPGELLDPADAQAVELRELFAYRGRGFSLSIVDRQCHRLLPSFLSPLATQLMPSILKFVDIFGFGLREGYNLPSAPTSSRGMVAEKRQTVGNLIIKRASWTFDEAAVPSPNLKPKEFFLEIKKWWNEIGLPPEMYMSAQHSDLDFRGGLTKPQYVHSDSVVLVEMLRESLQRKRGTLVLTEAVPRACNFPQDPRLGRRAVELIVESLALAPLAVSRPRSPGGELYQPEEPLLPTAQEV